MATGDLKGNLRKIEQGLRLLNYPRDVDYTGLAKGDPSAFLPIVSYCFTSFSTQITELLVESNVELTAKNDSRFVDAIYKFLRDQFQYKPVLSKQQFLQYGFAERKIQIVCDIISLIYKRHKELSNINKVKSQTRKKTHCVTSQLYVNTLNLDSAAISTTNFQEKPQVECHTSPLNAHIPEDKIDDVVEEESEVVCDAKILDNVHEMVSEEENNNQMEELKSQVAELQEKLNKLNLVEDKLQVLEEKLQGKVVIDEKEWNNLLSRVLLLETQLLLQSKMTDISAEFNIMNEENVSSRNMTPIFPEREKVELPESLHQSSGYSSLLSADPSPKAMVVNHGPSEVSKETTIQRMERISKMIEETSELLKTSSTTS
ncbi:centrosomal protein of 44 kDa isoform X1 [Hemicordylus capensis]|uniref:centrosomal protein of 44 kDa isoform X1 n=1 Tax=Hemicordylus capensis TaxID=884348 RepID=UPI002302E34C|nr:centrosomal protein of 44 kDa isoform X1 [Hemicordylus capensis]XP_053112137.1 centrosomal protein of 44 kDa isoform X1 [Hemicordylus capensis]XP_053112138.1 centrosomal protein of 44 kDa isoform X1 [Hemicordylus capensis]XP_053112139.1 centrosomal protein of 44 kDa isoform X1 [Hemicordylus capensis]